MRGTAGDPFAGGMPQLAVPRWTPMVKRLILANVAVYVVTLLLGFQDAAYAWVLETFGFAPRAWWESLPWIPIWQPVTYAFLHAKAPTHLLWNMLMLFFFGSMLEEIVGGRRFLAAYAGSLLAGALLHLVLAMVPALGGRAIGASGACLGVLVALATLRPATRVLLLFIPVTLKALAIGVVALDLVWLTLNLQGGVDGVAHGVHIGGAAWGFWIARSGWIWRDPWVALEARRAARREERRLSDEERMDQLLAKISREGMGSLTRAERAFLKRMSARR